MKPEHHLQTAAAYLRDNADLRTTLGIGPAADLRLRPLGAGEHNLNYRFDDPASGRSFVLRVNVASQPFHEDQVGYEFRALEALEPSGCTPQPLYCDRSRSAPGNGALVIGFCEGAELDFDALHPGDVRCALQLMADVHATPVPASCPLHRPADPLRELFEECMQRFEVYRASAFEEPRITTWANRFIAAARCALDVSCDPGDRAHIVNTEPLPSHFLIPAPSASPASAAGSGDSTGSNRLNAFAAPTEGASSPEALVAPGPPRERPGWFIDWERPLIGEVAQDVAYFVSPTTTFWDSDFLFPESAVEACVEAYWDAVDGRFARGSFDRRFPAYRTMTILRSVTWCCRALVTYRGAGAHTTPKTVRKLPVYLSDDFMEQLAALCPA